MKSIRWFLDVALLALIFPALVWLSYVYYYVGSSTSIMGGVGMVVLLLIAYLANGIGREQ